MKYISYDYSYFMSLKIDLLVKSSQRYTSRCLYMNTRLRLRWRFVVFIMHLHLVQITHDLFTYIVVYLYSDYIVVVILSLPNTDYLTMCLCHGEHTRFMFSLFSSLQVDLHNLLQEAVENLQPLSPERSVWMDQLLVKDSHHLKG